MIEWIANNITIILAVLPALYLIAGAVAKATETKIDDGILAAIGDMCRKYGPDITGWFQKRAKK